MSRYIEFMGLPGSGKSTLCRALLADPRARAAGILSNEEAVVRCLKRRDDGVLRNLLKCLPAAVWEPLSGSRNALAELHLFASENVPLLTLLFEMLNRRPLPLEWRQCILFAFFKRFAERRLMDLHLAPSEVVAVEEGFALGVITLLDTLSPGSPCEQEIERYVRSIPDLSGVFWIEVGPADCAARLRSRPELPLPWASRTEEQLLEQIAYSARCLELAAREFTRRGIAVCRVANPDGATDAARQVREQGLAWARRMMQD